MFIMLRLKDSGKICYWKEIFNKKLEFVIFPQTLRLIKVLLSYKTNCKTGHPFSFHKLHRLICLEFEFVELLNCADWGTAAMVIFNTRRDISWGEFSATFGFHCQCLNNPGVFLWSNFELFPGQFSIIILWKDFKFELKNHWKLPGPWSKRSSRHAFLEYLHLLETPINFQSSNKSRNLIW